MDYREVLSEISSSQDTIETQHEIRDKSYNRETRDFEFVRVGEPEGVVSFEATKNDRKKLLDHFTRRGYNSGIPRIERKFEKHVLHFRCCLDFWEQFNPGSQVFSKDEIYYRCLSEGHSFTEFIKKSRALTLQAMTSETDCDIPEEYYHPEYDGYNSIIHERYLIHWDDTKDVDDVKWAFLPTKEINEKQFRKMVKKLFSDMKVKEKAKFRETVSYLESLKATQMVNPCTGKTTLARELWSDDITFTQPYFAKRAVVPTTPGSTRDTGVGDPFTILKVKALNALARSVSEILPYSANTTAKLANSRYMRVLKKHFFVHLDFKKFGLSFPRILMNILIEELGEISGIDISPLLIHHFHIEIDGEIYESKRGTVLGWLDAINSLCVCAIIHDLKNSLGIDMDFVTFNDDVEISLNIRHNIKDTLHLVRSVIVSTMDKFDIPVSLTKTYASKASVFLERYAYFGKYGLNMYKEQLTVKAYALSCATPYIWRAKILFAAAEQWTKSQYADDRCIDTCPLEFSPDEVTQPLWAGGWKISRRNGLDYCMVDAATNFLRLGCLLNSWRPPRITIRGTDPPSAEKMERAQEMRLTKSHTIALSELLMKDDNLTKEIDEEVEYINESLETWIDAFPDTNNLCQRVRSFLERIEVAKLAVPSEDGKVYDPG